MTDGRLDALTTANPVRRGFTLVEVLVALTILSVIALMTWRGIDGMVRAQRVTSAYTDEVLALQAGLAQWQVDLDAMMIWPPIQDTQQTVQRSLSWDGRVVRITRTISGDAAAGLRVVAWARNPTDGAWRRWQSAPVRTLSAWRDAWESAARWAQSGAPAIERTQTPATPAQAVTIAATQDWQLYYFQGNAWTNPLSSTAQGQEQTRSLPEAIRLMITLAPGQAINGALVVDWIRPDFPGTPQ